MKKRFTTVFLLLCLLCAFGFPAEAEGTEGADEGNASAATLDVVTEESLFTEEDCAEDVFEESFLASDDFTEEPVTEENHAGSGIFDGPTAWFDEDGEEDPLKAYVEQRLNRERGFVHSSFYAGRRLLPSEPGQASVYFLLKDEIARVADGERTSTVFAGPISDLTEYGLIEKTKYESTELGYETVDEGNKQKVVTALLEKLNLLGITPALRALLADSPYELYWFNKTTSGGYNYSFQYVYDTDETGVCTIEVTDYTIRLAVSEKYATEKYEVTTEYADTVNAAIDNARAIVEAAEEYTDTGKLEYYLEQVCSLASYNSAAAHGGLPYGDPWQIIYVFDGDPATKVVCEGYAKAFAYLCELSWFREEVEWYTVTGRTTENHMWNIVSLNGNNFLVDPTNCDDGTIGQGKQLFLAGYDSGSVDEGYTFRCRRGSLTYYYDTNALSTFSRADLNLVPRGTDPLAPVKNGLTLDSDGIWRVYDRNVFDPVTGIVDYGGGRFLVLEGVLASEVNGLILIDGSWYYLSNGQVQDQYTGLALYDGEWFYITEGILDTRKNGLTVYNGGLFLVAAGQIRKDVSGLWLNAEAIGGDGSWYYLSNGQVQNQYTGLSQYDGEWFYIMNGRLAVEYTGTVYYDGHIFWVVNGQVVS